MQVASSIVCIEVLQGMYSCELLKHDSNSWPVNILIAQIPSNLLRVINLLCVFSICELLSLKLWIHFTILLQYYYSAAQSCNVSVGMHCKLLFVHVCVCVCVKDQRGCYDWTTRNNWAAVSFRPGIYLGWRVCLYCCLVCYVCLQSVLKMKSELHYASFHRCVISEILAYNKWK